MGARLSTIFLVALALRAGAMISLPVSLSDDGIQYLEMAQNMLAGHGFSVAKDLNGWRTGRYYLAMREPGISAFLAGGILAGNGNPWPAGVILVLLGALACLIIAVLAQRLYGPRAGLIAGLLAAVYPPLVCEANGLQREQLLTFFVLSGAALLALALERRAVKFYLLGGALFGLSMLAEESFLFFPFLFLIWSGLHAAFRKSWRRVLGPAVFFLAAALVVLPWTLRNRAILIENAENERASWIAKWQHEIIPFRAGWRLLSKAGAGPYLGPAAEAIREVLFPSYVEALFRASLAQKDSSIAQPAVERKDIAAVTQPLAERKDVVVLAPAPLNFDAPALRIHKVIFTDGRPVEKIKATGMYPEKERVLVRSDGLVDKVGVAYQLYPWLRPGPKRAEGLPMREDAKATLRLWALKTYLVPWGMHLYLEPLGRLTVWAKAAKMATYVVYWAVLVGFVMVVFNRATYKDSRQIFFVACIAYLIMAAAAHATPGNRFFYPALPFLLILGSKSLSSWLAGWAGE